MHGYWLVVDGVRVNDIVTNEGDLIVLEPVPLEDRLVDPDLVKGALMDFRDPELPRPYIHNLGFPSGDDADGDASPLGEFDPVAIAHMERLEFIALVVQNDPAVGKDAVHIEQEHLDLLRFGF